MARVQYGALITALKGNIGGQTFQGGNVSSVMRNKGYTKGNTTSYRRRAIDGITAQANAWRDLTDLERAAWASASGTWAFTDKFGNVYYGSGYQLFVAWNSALASMGFATVTAPSAPETLETISFDPITWSLSGGFILEWGTSTAITQMMQVYASPCMSAGRNDFHKPTKQIVLLDANDGHNYDMAADYQNVYGQGLVGSRIIVTINVRGQVFPRIYQTYTTSLIVTA